MRIRTWKDQTLMRLLSNAAGASYTQSWAQQLADYERLLYILVGHASVDVLFNVQVATDSGGTGAESIFTSIDADEVGLFWLEIGPAVLNRLGKFYVSPLVTWTAGTFSLIEVKYNLRQEGNLADLFDATVIEYNQQLT